MGIDQLIAQVRQSINDKLTARTTHTEALATIRGAMLADKRDAANDDEAAKIKEHTEARAALDSEIEQLEETLRGYEQEKARDEAAGRLAREVAPSGAPLPKYDQVGRTGQEPRTYTPETAKQGRSYFADAWNAHRGNPAASERISRHGKEVEVHSEMTERALNTGGIAGLTVPQYLVDMAAPVLRAGRPLANLVNRHELPDAGMSLIIPRGTTGATAASQATENSAVSSTDEVWANLTVPVVTIAGQAPVSRQSLERGEGVDEIIFLDLAKAHAAQLDNQTINGTGSSNQFLGILNTASINTSTAYGAAVTVATFTLKKAGQIAAVTSAGAGIWPKLLVMHPRRWGWLTGVVDSNNRPVVVANQMGPYNAMGLIPAAEAGKYGGDPDGLAGSTIVGVDSSGLPILTDLNIPTNVGTPSEDVVLALDTNEIHLWEDGDGLPRQLTFEQTAGPNLTTTLVVYSYAAFTAGRYPQAVGRIGGADTVGGQGQIAPTF